jgi:hypothetical protein
METNPITLEDLRALIAKTDALTHATAELFDDVVHVDAVDDRRTLERLAHLVSAAADAAALAVEAGDQLATESLRGARG